MNRIVSRLFAPAVLLMGVLMALAPSAMSQAYLTGQWQTMPYTMPINPIHVSLLYTGDVLITPGTGNDAENPLFQAGLWDPAAGTITVQMVDFDMFCNGMVSLPDGRAIIAGGTISYGPPFLGSSRVAIYDPTTGQFTDQQSMAHGRWYPTVTTLGDGREMVFSGLSDTGPMNSTIEFYTVGVGWSPEYPVPSAWTPPTYPRMHLLPNGNVFYSGPDPNSHLYNPTTNTWTLNIANTNYGGFRLYGSSVLLPLTPANGYKPRVIIFGGGTNTTPATATSEIIDLSAANPQWVYGPTMIQPRIEMDATILPDGRVLTLGGSVNDEDGTTAGLNAEMYDPNTNLLTPAGSEAYARLYHTVSLLMPDGTVWVAGGNPLRGVYETHMEIYSPSYLFNPDGSPAPRPAITSVSQSKIGYNAAFQVQTPNAANISNVVLMRLGSSTHAFDMDQRYVGLSYTAGNGVLNVVSPPTSNIAPPGYYMLFILNSAGVPSVASIVQLSANPTDQPPHSTITSPAADATVIAGHSISFAGTAADSDGTISKYYWTFFGGTPSFSNVQNPGNVTYSVPGTYVATLTSTDNNGVTELHPATRAVTVPDFSVAVSPTFQTVTAGGNATYTLTATGTPGFTGNVALSVSGLPAGTTASFNPASITNSGSSTITISTPSSLAAQGYSITVTAVSGIVTHSKIFSLLVSQGGGTSVINLNGGFSASGMQFNGNAKLNGTGLQLTDSNTQNETGSAYWTTPVNVQSFTTDFTFQVTNPNPDAGLADGFTFMLQNAGLTALGSAGGGLGFSGVAPSVAVKFDLFDNSGEGDNSTGLFIDGAAPTTPAVTLGGGVNLHSGDVFEAHVVYDGVTLTLTLTDMNSGGSFTTAWPVNIPGTFGSNTAFAGFSAGTGGQTATQEILGWTYAVSTVTLKAPAPTFSPLAGTYTGAQGVTISDGAFGASIFYTLDGTTPATTAGGSTLLYTGPVQVATSKTIKALAAGTGLTPSPVASSAYAIQAGTPAINFGPGFSAAGMQFNGTATLNGARLQLTDNNATLEGASAYWTTPVNVQSFTNDFTFQLTNPSADGFTFVLQDAGLAALGTVGGGLGYAGMTPAVAVKFDLYDNEGEGNNTTGLFLEGASPTLPATTLGGGVSLHSGDILQVHMVYDGTTLTMTITDTTNPTETFTTAWTVNIPATLGANTAWAGFTGGTGGLTATQEILTWTYSTGVASVQTATPTFTPVGGNYPVAQTVTISDMTAGASIFYTVDGTTPATTAGGSTIQYLAPVSVAASETMKAIATAPGASASPVATAAYTIAPLAPAATPVIKPAAGTYTTVQTITITDATAGATIYYTLDGTPPTIASPVYTAAFTLNATATVKAIATATGFSTSATASNAYTVNLPRAATPVIRPAARTYTTVQTITITDTTAGAVIYYTLDGTTPTITSPIYTAAFPLNISATVKAVAISPTTSLSAVATATYTINLPKAATPVIKPNAGTYTVAQTVTITDTTTGAAIHYTLDGTTPTITSPTYTAAFQVAATTTVKAIATAAANSPSNVATSIFTITQPAAATPVIKPNAGTYTTVQTVTITDTTAGAVIYYTLDGTTPTITSPTYTAALTVNASTTVKAIAAATGLANSAVATAAYTINLPAAATPVIKPNAGTYTAAQTVTITDTTTGAAIHYTLDGTTPTITSPTYTAGFQVAVTTTVKAIATAAANAPSAIATSTFTITQPAAATPVIQPAAGTYTTVQTVTITDTTAGAAIHYTLDGTTPTIASPTYAAAFTLNATTTVKAIAVATGFANSATATSAYTINLPRAATPVITPATGTYTTAPTVTITDTTAGAAIHYTLDGSTPTIASPTYTAAFTLNATTTVKAIATAAAFSPSATATATYTINLPKAATPVIAPAAGTYAAPLTVTITDTSAGSAIHYTLDGTTPTAASPTYTAGLTINATTTVKAIALGGNFGLSATATTAYTIQGGGGGGGGAAINFGTGFTAAGMQFNGNAKLNGARLQLTDSITGMEGGSAYWTTPVNAQSFTNDFTFQLTNPNADGFTFMLQNKALTALGTIGGGLGSSGVAPSVAVKFDLYDNSGEGNNSTGLYSGGASPNLPSTTLGGGVNLHSGDIFQVHMAYDGTTLTMTITDTANAAQTFTTSWPIDIPAALGGNTAWAGFTAGTGGGTATQEVLTWTYTH